MSIYILVSENIAQADAGTPAGYLLVSDANPIPVIIGGTGSTKVEGRAADGAPPVGFPVLMAGWDGVNVQTIATDATGNVMMKLENVTVTATNLNVRINEADDSVQLYGFDSLVNRALVTTLGTGRLIVDVFSSALPTGASTSALQTTGNTSLASIDTKLTAPLSTNWTQVNGTTLLANTGATGAGSPRVTVAVDTATVAGSASLPTGANTIGNIGTVTTVTTVSTVTAVTAITNALPAGTNAIGIVSTKTALTAAAPTASSVGVASAQAVASNAARKGLILVNTSVNTISLGFSGNAAVLNSGVTLQAGGTFSMGEYDFTTGQVNAIASVVASNLSIQEF